MSLQQTGELIVNNYLENCAKEFLNKYGPELQNKKKYSLLYRQLLVVAKDKEKIKNTYFKFKETANCMVIAQMNKLYGIDEEIIQILLEKVLHS